MIKQLEIRKLFKKQQQQKTRDGILQTVRLDGANNYIRASSVPHEESAIRLFNQGHTIWSLFA